MTPKNQKEMNQFLAKTRLGYLTVLAQDGAPKTVPIWYDWDGQAIQMFTAKTSAKVKRLRRDPRATFVVGNDVGEPEGWVAFDGAIEIREEEPVADLINKLAHRYWEMSTPATQAVVDDWLANPDQFCLLLLRPERIRSYLS